MSELFYILLPLVILYTFKLYPFFRKDIGYLLLIFWITGVAALTREFTYIRFGFIYITEVIITILIFIFAIRTLLGRRLIGFKSDLIGFVLLFLFIYQSWGLLRLIYDLLSFNPSKPSVASEEDVLTVLRNFSLVYYSIFVYLVLVILNSDTERKVELIFKSVLLFSMLRNIVVVILFVLGYESFVPEDGGIIGGHHSLISSFAFFISLYFLIERKDLRYLLLLLLNLLFVFLSSHRSAYLSLIGGVLMLILLYRGQIKLKLFAVLLSVSLSFFILLVSLSDMAFILIIQKISENIRSLVYYKLSDPNAYWRYLYWINVLNSLVENPTGVGFNYSLGSLAPWWIWSENPREILYRGSLRLDPHNSYLSILARTGLPGFFVFFLFLLFFLFALKVGYKRLAGKHKSLLVVSFTNFVAVSIFAFFNVTLENPYHGAFFWIWMGVCLSIVIRANLNRSNGQFMY